AKVGRDRGVALGIESATPEQRGAWRQNVPLQGEPLLYLAGWYRTENVAKSDGRGAAVRMTFLKSRDKWDLITDPRVWLEPSPDWKRFEHVLPVPQGAQAVCPELFNFFAPGKVWWDDMEMRQATAEEAQKFAARALDREPDASQVGYAPADAAVTTVNPPAFVWTPVAETRTYVLQYSPDPSFKSAQTVTVRDLALSVFTPHEALATGRWRWRYGFEAGGGTQVFSRVRSFEIPTSAREFPRPRLGEVLAKISKGRPRLYFTPETSARIRSDSAYAPLVQRVVRGAERRLGEKLYPEPAMLPSSGLERSVAYQECFKTMRPFTGGMEECALAYAVTGERRFADEAKRRLLHFASWNPAGSTNVFHNDEAAMDIAMRGPRTFDWIHDVLMDVERAQCQEMLRVRLGQIRELHRRRRFESSPYESHAGRMVGFMVEGSLAFAHEVPEAPQWLDYYLQLLWSVYPAWGSDDGGWAEGMSYWSAYMSMLTPLVFVLDAAGVPFKRKPFFENTGYFGLYCLPPFSKVRPYGDGHEGGAGGGDGILLHLHSTLHRNPYFRWYADTMKSGPGAGPASFIALDPSLEPKPPSELPQARCFSHVGWVAMHSNLADPKNNIHFMLKSSAYGSMSHSHASQNAFILNAFGEPLAISSGYYQLYGSPHHAGWTRETKAHCAVTVDGKGQEQRSRTANGRIADFADTKDFCYAVGDATKAYGGRLEKFLRHVVFVRPDYFVLFDDLRSAIDSEFQWWLHAKREMKLDEPGQAVTISEGDARLLVRFLSPTPLKFAQTDKFDVPAFKEAPNQWHFTATPTSKRREVRCLTLLAPYRTGGEAELPTVKALDASSGAAFEVRGPWGHDLVAWRTGAEKLKAGELEADAQLVVIRRSPNGRLRNAFVHRGTAMVAGQAFP
ncbi:MAG: DUF4962 domain-containing protein, partial [Planctomycetes bacterium]|nr:DUF4962 domain-containing protein [Planctomycetota bacterium]